MVCFDLCLGDKRGRRARHVLNARTLEAESSKVEKGEGSCAGCHGEGGFALCLSAPPLWRLTFPSLSVAQKVLDSQLELRVRNAHAGFMGLREPVVLCVCVCVCERERESDRKREGKREG